MDETVTREIVKGWMANLLQTSCPDGPQRRHDEAKWLLMFDNADDPELLFDWWPATDVGSVIVIGRDALAKEAPCAPTAGVDLVPFSNDDGGRLLQKNLET